jgi:hypothetical protein
MNKLKRWRNTQKKRREDYNGYFRFGICEPCDEYMPIKLTPIV